MVEVVAALIRCENKFLICKRPKNKVRGLLWEFVGGKVEKNESRKQAIIRECMEELGVEISVGDEFCKIEQEYPDLSIRLTVFECKITKGKIKPIEHSALAWITPDETSGYQFCPADVKVINMLKEKSRSE